MTARGKGKALAAAAAAVLVLLVAGCAAGSTTAGTSTGFSPDSDADAATELPRNHVTPTQLPTHASADALQAPTIAIVGDSTTAWDYSVGGDPTLSWTTTALQSVQMVCGWAESGATVSVMLEAATPCPQARFLVLMGGTNDIPGGGPIDARLAAIDGIAATVGAQYTVIVLVAPLDKYASGVLEWNAALTAHAQQRGWMLVDPWAPVRDPSGAFLPGTAIWDNVHPTPETAVVVGTNMARALTLADKFLP